METALLDNVFSAFAPIADWDLQGPYGVSGLSMSPDSVFKRGKDVYE